MKELKISAIKEGTVIDHISPENTFKVAEFLDLKKRKDLVMIGANLFSQKLDRKGVIKIGNNTPTKREMNKIALIAPEANLNIIKDYNVVRKEKIKIPEVIEEIIDCPNPNCITNAEKCRTRFYVLTMKPLKLRCHYCERVMESSDIEVV